MVKLTMDPSRIFFTSDSHYGHKNICRGISDWGTGNKKDGTFKVNIDGTRDFANLEKMNSAIVDRINDVVGQDDVLIHGGDWSFGGGMKIKEFRDRIVCKNVILVYGNHDTNIRKNAYREQELFKLCTEYLELDVNDTHKIVVFHYPIESWNGMRKGVIMLQGHQHLKGEIKFRPGKRMDIGACGNDLHPYSLEEILKIMNKRDFVPVANDHHQ